MSARRIAVLVGSHDPAYFGVSSSLGGEGRAAMAA